MSRALTLTVLAARFAVARLAPDVADPSWARGGEFVAISRTSEELSVVCREGDVPEGVRAGRGLRCLRVVGPLPFDAVGVLASLTAPLAAAGISLFAVSTFDTDYLLVKEQRFADAVAALRHAGHAVIESGHLGM